MYREFELIERIQAYFYPVGAPDFEGVEVAIGDDCAVLSQGVFDLISTDTLVENVHFRREWSSPRDIGYKSLAVSLSDVAAMAGAPRAFLLNIAVSPETDEKFVDELILGVRDARDEARAQGFEVALIGGDVTSVPAGAPLMLTTTVLGESPPQGAVLRAGARPGDRVVLLGPTGLAAAGLALLEEQDSTLAHSDYPALLDAHRRPRARVWAGSLIGRSGLAHAMIDTSDGLLSDLGHILTSSGVGARLYVQDMPDHAQLQAFCDQKYPEEQRQSKYFEYLFGGGEDFQLCLTLPESDLAALRKSLDEQKPPRAARASTADGLKEPVDTELFEIELFDIGEIRPQEEGISVYDAAGAPLELPRFGFEHFVS